MATLILLCIAEADCIAGPILIPFERATRSAFAIPFVADQSTGCDRRIEIDGLPSGIDLKPGSTRFGFIAFISSLPRSLIVVPDPTEPAQTVEGRAELSDIFLLASVVSLPAGQPEDATQDYILEKQFQPLWLMGSSLEYHVDCGEMAEAPVRLAGGKGMGMIVAVDPSNPEESVSFAVLHASHYDLGADLPFGAAASSRSRSFLRIEIWATLKVDSTDPDVLPVSAVVAHLFGDRLPELVLQDLVEGAASTLKRASGAPLAQLVLYDFAVFPRTLSGPPIPSDLLSPPVGFDGDLTDPAGLGILTFPRLWGALNQYDAGAEYNLPWRFGKKGGHSCGPVALSMVLSLRLSSAALSPSIEALFDNTMTRSLASARAAGPSGIEALFNPVRACQYIRKTAALNSSSCDYGTATTKSGMSAVVDNALARGSYVLVSTTLTSFRTPSTGVDPEGGGHVIAILNSGESAAVGDWYGTGGRYYVVCDPGGHYFANRKEKHYARALELAKQQQGVNYAGWFAIYPRELLVGRFKTWTLEIGGGLPNACLVAPQGLGITFRSSDGQVAAVRSDGTTSGGIPGLELVRVVGEEESPEPSEERPTGEILCKARPGLLEQLSIILQARAAVGESLASWTSGVDPMTPTLKELPLSLVPGEARLLSWDPARTSFQLGERTAAVSILRNPSGQLILRVSGLAGTTYAVEASSDLKTWGKVSEIVPGSELPELPLLQSNGARYWRTRLMGPQ